MRNWEDLLQQNLNFWRNFLFETLRISTGEYHQYTFQVIILVLTLENSPIHLLLILSLQLIDSFGSFDIHVHFLLFRECVSRPGFFMKAYDAAGDFLFVVWYVHTDSFSDVRLVELLFTPKVKYDEMP